ncbi:hypothetical protein [Streptomyces sp. HUAS TT20]|uniref:hypothetical protein n=1 Tax=Streptomyces sp. HUAS TT20 TaxID=3447509 RepID=UPI0021DB1005|nr:hypothetical protein [Streptomyces sp. HUAS 15-9]UXY25153.1 hypothetical protein N8I87_00180 [Streptomyces sp. HUAS 15-9]
MEVGDHRPTVREVGRLQAGRATAAIRSAYVRNALRPDGTAHRAAEAAEKQSAHATVNSDHELQALAQELRDRLTAEQVEKLIKLLKV